MSEHLEQQQAAAIRPTSVYAAVGATITNHVLDTATGRLTPRGELALPSRAQYGWAHPVLPVLYVACADRSSEPGRQPFYLCALARDAGGDLSMIHDPVTLSARPIHLTVDRAGAHVLVAYGEAPGLSVFALEPDGAVGAEVPRTDGFDFGNKPHQVRVVPGDDRAILVARGAKGFGKPAYVEGGLKLVRYDQGVVETLSTAAPSVAQAPAGFNPRNIDFHPQLPLLYATLEAQNELAVFRMAGSAVEPAPLFTRNILARPDDLHKRQDGGEVLIHPDGRTAYVANRNDGNVGGHDGRSWLNPDPTPVFPGGENNIAVFRLDAATGEPTLVGHEDSRGLHPRTFALDAGGRWLIAGNVAPTRLRKGEAIEDVPANLAVFRVAHDGTLTFVRRHDLDVGAEKVGWMGMVG